MNSAKLRCSVAAWNHLTDDEFNFMLSCVGDCESTVAYSEELMSCISKMTGFNIVVLDVVVDDEAQAGEVAPVEPLIYYSTDTLGMSYCMHFSCYIIVY